MSGRWCIVDREKRRKSAASANVITSRSGNTVHPRLIRARVARIPELCSIAQQSRKPAVHTFAMQVDCRSIVAAPHDRRVLQKLAAVKAPMSGSREPEGVLDHLGHVAREAHIHRCQCGADSGIASL